MKKFFLIVFVISGILIFGYSCLNKNDNSNPQQGAFLISNLSPDAPTLNVSLNSRAFGSGLSFGVYTQYYLETAGSYTVDFSNTDNAIVLSKTINLEVNKYYSLFVVDSFAHIKASFVEDNLNATSSDSVYIRFFNLSPNAGALNLKDSVAGTNIYSTRNFNDQDGSATNQSFIRIPKGIYTFQLTKPDGSIVASKKDTLSGLEVYTIYANGFLGGTGTQSIGIGQIRHL